MRRKPSFRSVVLALFVLFATAHVSTAFAQGASAGQGAQGQLEATTAATGPTDPRVARARALFVSGVALLDQQLYTDALHSFQQSFELVRRPNSLNNIGVCLRAIGRHREARDHFNQLLTEFPNADAALVQQARQFRDEEARKVATLTLTGLPEVEGITVRVDSQDVDMPNTRPARFEVDPGTRSVDISAPGYEVFHWSERATEGESLEVPVNMVPLPEAPSIASSPWLWIAVVAVVAAGAGVTYYFLDKDAQLDARSPIVVNL